VYYSECFNKFINATYTEPVEFRQNYRIPQTESRSEYLQVFEMWSWRRMEKISWTDRAKNEKVIKKPRKKGTSYIK
jgi:hypothetical protein